MFGEPGDVDGQCNARLFIGDNYGDGTATMRCQRAPSHEGLHKEEFERKGGAVTITWIADERERCDHGCGQWDHDHRDESVRCPRDADDHEWSDCACCHPGEPTQTCAACGKPYYDEAGHKRHCPKEPYTCATCGESGIGPHDWPSGCPKEREMFLARGTADEFTTEESP
jgi:hypothetical protein